MEVSASGHLAWARKARNQTTALLPWSEPSPRELSREPIEDRPETPKTSENGRRRTRQDTAASHARVGNR